MSPIPVLVTGVGAPVGVGIIKALRAADLPVRVIGVDAEPLAQGLFRVDRAHLVPSARKEPDAYFEALVRIAREEGAAILFSGWEGELPLLAERKAEFEQRTGAVLPLAPAPTMTALDKWLTVQALLAAGLPAPDSALPADLNAFRLRHDFPYVVKPRRGSGGRGLFIVQSQRELDFFTQYVPDPIVQELLPGDDREYTVGVFLQENQRPAGVLALKRTLSGGLSYRMESEQHPEVCETAARAAAALGLIGPVNVQLRLTPAGPKVFEINPRCSSATCVRAQFGLNEPEMAIRRFVLGEELLEPQIKEGHCLRFWEELYLPEGARTEAERGAFPWRGQVIHQF